MKSTNELLARAAQVRSLGAWAAQLGLERTTLYKAKDRCMLMPNHAGLIAIAIGEDPIYWMTAAVVEAEKDPEHRATLEASISQAKAFKQTVRKPYFRGISAEPAFVHACAVEPGHRSPYAIPDIRALARAVTRRLAHIAPGFPSSVRPTAWAAALPATRRA